MSGTINPNQALMQAAASNIIGGMFGQAGGQAGQLAGQAAGGVGVGGASPYAVAPSGFNAGPSPVAASPVAAQAAEDARGVSGPSGTSGGGGGLQSLMNTAGDVARYAQMARRLYNVGDAAYNAYQTGGNAALGASIASNVISPIATAIAAKAAQTLAKDGRQTGATIGTAGGAALGMLGGPLAPLTVPLGALIGGAIGGQIGPNPTVGMNFANVGTFGGDGTLQFGQGGGDNGGTAQQAQELSQMIQQALPAFAASQGLAFNPAAAGQPFTTGLYGTGGTGRPGGLFYAPTGSPGQPERWAAFSRDPEAYLNTIMGDLVARGIYHRSGTEAPTIRDTSGTGINSLSQVAPGHGLVGLLNQGGPDLNSWQSVANWQDVRLQDQFNRQSTENNLLRLGAEQYERDLQAAFERDMPWGFEQGLTAADGRILDGRWVRTENYAAGGLASLGENGKLAIGAGGGLDDLIPTTIDGRRAAALSDGEFVVPADVVSMMGDGSSNEGSRRLYDLVKQVREHKTGTGRQAGPLPVGSILRRAMS
jgi:hypothetical protein